MLTAAIFMSTIERAGSTFHVSCLDCVNKDYHWRSIKWVSNNFSAFDKKKSFKIKSLNFRKIFERNLLMFTWWQDCPPATNFIAKKINSPFLARNEKIQTMGRRIHNSKTLHAGFLPSSAPISASAGLRGFLFLIFLNTHPPPTHPEK